MNKAKRKGISHTSGFTLVELIVVITIIAILGTVGFISYSSYLTSVRDANRVAQLVRISDALQIYSTRNDLPMPDNAVEITASGTTYAYQGDLGESVLQAVEYSSNAKDPKDEIPFTYFMSENRKNFQLLAFMEEASSAKAHAPIYTDAYANMYENRYPKTYGNRLGVLTDDKKNPIQNLPWTNNTLEITSFENELISYLTTDEYIQGDVDALVQHPKIIQDKGKDWRVEDNSFTSTSSGDSGSSEVQTIAGYVICNNIESEVIDVTNNITGKTWMDRNLGASQACTSSTDANCYGDLFQFGRFADGHQCRNSGTTSELSSSNTPDHNQFITNTSSSTFYAWQSPISGNLWQGKSGINNPCPTGYRIPTKQEMIEEHTSWSTQNAAGAYSSVLQLPLSGLRYFNSGNIGFSGGAGYYWTSEGPINDYFTAFTFGEGDPFGVDDGWVQGYGYAVRCIKD